MNFKGRQEEGAIALAGARGGGGELRERWRWTARDSIIALARSRIGRAPGVGATWAGVPRKI